MKTDALIKYAIIVGIIGIVIAVLVLRSLGMILAEIRFTEYQKWLYV